MSVSFRMKGLADSIKIIRFCMRYSFQFIDIMITNAFNIEGRLADLNIWGDILHLHLHHLFSCPAVL